MGRWLVGLSTLSRVAELDADLPIDETALSIEDVKEAVAKWLLKAGGEAMIRGWHAELTAVWHSGTISPDWKKGLVVSIWKGKGDHQDCNNYH